MPTSAQRLFRLLGVHPGAEIDVPAATALSGDDPAATVRAMKTLAAAHLVSEASPGRYARHDLVRLYTYHLSLRSDPAEAERARDRLLDHYLDAAETHHQIVSGRLPHPAVDDPAASVRWFRAEVSALRALVITAVEHGRPAKAWRLVDHATAIYRVCRYGGSWADVVRVGLDAAIADKSNTGIAQMLRRLAAEEADSGRLETALTHIRRALEIAGVPLRAAVSIDLAYYLARLGRYEDARDHLAEALILARQDTRPDSQARAHNNIGNVLVLCNEADLALEHAQHSLELLDDEAVSSVHAYATHTYGRALEQLGRLDEALAAYRRAASYAQQLGSTWRQASNVVDAGTVLARLGRPAEARLDMQKALQLYTRLGVPDVQEVREHLAALDSGRTDLATNNS